METEGDQLVKDAETNQAAQDKATQDYVGAGTDQAEAFANDPQNASGSKPGGGVGGRAAAAVKGLTAVVGRNKKKFGVGGGAAGLLLALILGFMSLLPLKLESLLENVFKAEFGRVENYGERRAQKVVYRYLVDKVGGAAGSDPIFIGNNLFTTLYGNMRVNNFETKLLKEKGIKITPGSKPGTVNFALADGPDKLSNADLERLAKYFDSGDLKGRPAREAIKVFTKETTKWYQVLQRRHLRRYIQNAFGIRKWAIPERTNKEAASVDPKLPSPTQTDVAQTTLSSAEEANASALDCMLADKCPEVDKRTSPDGIHQGGPPITDNQNPADEEKVAAEKAQAADETKTTVKDSYNEIRNSSRAAISGGIEKTLGPIFENSLVKAFTKAIPVVGWIALASSIDNFMWNGHIRTVLIAMHSAQYASVFANYSSIKDQLKEGKLGGQQVNDVMVAFEGSEKSAAFQSIYMNADAGEKIDPSKSVGSLSGVALGPTGSSICDADYFLTHMTNTNVPAPDPSNPDYWTFLYRGAMSAPGGGAHTALCLVHPLLSWAADKLGAAVGFILDVLFKILNFLTMGASGAILKNAMEAVTVAMTFTMQHVFTPVATGFETKAPLYNAIHAGGDVTANQFTRDTLGGKTISAQAAHDQMAAINREEALNLRQQGMMATIFSLKSTQSFASRLLGYMPSTPGYAFKQISTTAIAAIGNPFRFFSTMGLAFMPTAGAGVITDPYGIQQFGYTAAELDDNNLHIATTDIAGPPGADGVLSGADGVIDEYDCPPNDDPSKPDLCLIDSAIIQSMNSIYTTSDDGGLGGTNSGNPSTPSAPPTSPPATGDVKALAIQMLANNNITYWTNNGVNTRDLVVALSQGKPAYTTCANAPKRTTPIINPNILKFILEAAGQTHVMVNAITDKCHSSSTSNHYTGEAVDLDLTSGPLSILNPIAAKYGGVKNSETSHYHYDFLKVTP